MTGNAASRYYFSNYFGNYFGSDRHHGFDGAVQVQQPNVGVEVAREFRVRVPHQSLRQGERNPGDCQPSPERRPEGMQVHALAAIVKPVDAPALAIGVEPLDQVRREVVHRVARLPLLDSPAQDLDQLGRERDESLFLGARGPGGFPPPVCEITDGVPLWRWCEVAYWLGQNDMVTEDVVRAARDTEAINSILEFMNQKALQPGLMAKIMPLFPTLIDQFEDARAQAREELAGKHEPASTASEASSETPTDHLTGRRVTRRSGRP